MSYPKLDDTTSVAPQITPDTIPDLVAAGITTVICNRPDNEVPPEVSSATLRAACQAAGLGFVDNPLAPGGLTRDAIEAQADALSGANGPVLAYCASGTRSALLWAFASAARGTHAPQEIEAALAGAGYSFPGIARQLQSFSENDS